MESILSLLLLLATVNADIYLHNPRGSNNRLDEEGRERNNANRLFDSQNNNRGGYNVGSLYYYEGSKLPIEWTNQHSCNDPNSHCELIVQYMCDDSVRDGSTTTTIPDNPMQCEDYHCNSDTKYGMHEDYYYYLECKLRERNMGLFTADQNLHGRNRAKNTRQNPNGNRRGYECPEERDYYPYWHPSPWKDVAVMTNDATRCIYYQEESQNVKSRWACVIPRDILINNANKGLVIPNNQDDCDAFRWPQNNPNGTRGVWTEFPSHNLPAPECRETEHSRDNHLGNGIGGYPNVFNWTIPDINHERCVLRIRYNISTNEYDAWNGINATHNKPTRGRHNKAAQIDLSEKFTLQNEEEANQRGYIFKNNPQVQIFPGLENLKFRLAINTAQYGRTFQDRSHTFAVRRRPAELQGAVIHNVNVRGKRGNIVQVYPAVEYDFVPNTLEMVAGEYVHYQWTGSNTNPHNNDGQGRAGTDRSNIVIQREQIYAEGDGSAYAPGSKFGHWGRSYPAYLSNNSFGLSKDDLMNLALLTPGQFGGEMSELDDAGTYFDLGPRKITKTGSYHYLCTRNNNFSNRSQKGRLLCHNRLFTESGIGWTGGVLAMSDGTAEVRVDQGTFAQFHKLRLEKWTSDQGEELLKKHEKKNPGGNYASSYLAIYPEAPLAAEGKSFKVALDVSGGSALEEIIVYRSHSDGFNTWTRVDADISDGVASFAAQEGGVYVAMGHTKVGTIVGAVFGCLILIALVVGAVFFFRKNPNTLTNFKRTFNSKV